MRGEFRIYQNGKLLSKTSNVITTAGRNAIQKYLAGQVPSFAEAIGLGVGQAAATTGDTRLSFEVARAPIDLKNSDFTAQQIVFKATLPQEDVYTIYEFGTWSQESDALSAEFSSRLITTFDMSFEAWTNVGADTVNARTSVDAAIVTVPASSTVQVRNTSAALDLSGYSGNDQFSIAFYKPDNNIAGLTLVFENTALGAKFASAEIGVAALPVGYNVVTLSKSSLSPTGSMSWDTINQYGFDVRAGGSGSTLTLDGLRIEDTDTFNPNYTMVSRAVIATPVVKTNVAPLEVEYALTFGVT